MLVRLAIAKWDRENHPSEHKGLTEDLPYVKIDYVPLQEDHIVWETRTASTVALWAGRVELREFSLQGGKCTLVVSVYDVDVKAT